MHIAVGQLHEPNGFGKEDIFQDSRKSERGSGLVGEPVN